MLSECVVFVLNNIEYCLEIKKVKEIINFPNNITILPNVDKSVNGLINLRGEVVPVINLRDYFGIKEKKEKHIENKFQDMVIIVKMSDNRMIGFVVDLVLSIDKVEIDNSINPGLISSPLPNDFIEKYIKIDENKMYVLLNIEKVFSKERILNL